jgi:hypothetical protein
LDANHVGSADHKLLSQTKTNTLALLRLQETLQNHRSVWTTQASDTAPEQAVSVSCHETKVAAVDKSRLDFIMFQLLCSKIYQGDTELLGDAVTLTGLVFYLEYALPFGRPPLVASSCHGRHESSCHVNPFSNADCDSGCDCGSGARDGLQSSRILTTNHGQRRR